jgi:poly(ADP-ribose) glycohydrolase ARH3
MADGRWGVTSDVMVSEIDVEKKFRGGMLGTGVGDAIGELAFRRPSVDSLKAEVEARDELVYTDDTAMAIGLAESVVEREGLDQAHLGETFRANYRREPWRGYASGPPTVFSKVEEQGLSYPEAAHTLYGGEGSFGNGAAMRIAALGLTYHDHEDLYEKARASAEVTHAHPVGIDGAAVQARAVAWVVSLNPGDAFPVHAFLDALLETARTAEMGGKLASVRDLVGEGEPPGKAARRLGMGVAVDRSQPFALYAFLRHPHSFEETLFCAALNGGDRDTMAAMACAISGAYLGEGGIPAEWRQKLENRAMIEALATRLAGLA